MKKHVLYMTQIAVFLYQGYYRWSASRCKGSSGAFVTVTFLVEIIVWSFRVKAFFKSGQILRPKLLLQSSTDFQQTFRILVINIFHWVCSATVMVLCAWSNLGVGTSRSVLKRLSTSIQDFVVSLVKPGATTSILNGLASLKFQNSVITN